MPNLVACSLQGTADKSRKYIQKYFGLQYTGTIPPSCLCPFPYLPPFSVSCPPPPLPQPAPPPVTHRVRDTGNIRRQFEEVVTDVHRLVHIQTVDHFGTHWNPTSTSVLMLPTSASLLMQPTGSTILHFNKPANTRTKVSSFCEKFTAIVLWISETMF